FLYPAVHGIHTDAASEHLGRLRMGGKAWMEDQPTQFFLRQKLVGADKTALDGGLTDGSIMQPGPVVMTAHYDCSAFTHEIQSDGTDSGFAEQFAVFGPFDAVVNRVAEQVHQRVDHTIEYVAIHERLRPPEDEFRFFPGESAGLADTALQPLGDCFDRHH